MSLDKDGYPTKENLKKIKNWDVIKDPYGLAEFIEDNWWMPDWGYKLRGRKLELHTGGWSGNEETISILQRTFFWFFYWVQSRRGGHYYFELPKRNINLQSKTKNKMTKTISIIALTVLLFACKKESTLPTLTSEAHKAQVAEVTTLLFNPCTNENMQLSGKLIYQIHDNVAQFHYAGVVGTGLTTGNKYQCIGNQIEVYNGNAAMYHYSVLITVPGSGNNLAQSLQVNVNLNRQVENITFKDAYCK